jgi:16S rRNA (cytosine1402-N4)-methyltransferase
MLFTPSILTLAAVRNSAASVALARVSELDLFSDKVTGSGQHATMSNLTDVRTAPGWLSARHPQIFMEPRKRSLGTELLAHFESMVRTAPGWLSVRPSQVFGQKQNHALGTAQGFADQADVRIAPGWLSVRRLITFITSRMEFSGTVLHSFFETMARATKSVLVVQPLPFSTPNQNHVLGTVQDFVDLTDACAAPGWLSAQAPVDFSENPAAGAYHLPVFPAEVATWMATDSEKFIIDGTLGGGGHSEIFLNAGARVLGVDRDPEALSHARARLSCFGPQFVTWEGNFTTIGLTPQLQAGERADGLLLDLGVSSRQLDSASRGFSFMREGPLDMRMGPSSPRTAADLINRASESELVRILFEFGEESKARRIVAAIIQQRSVKPFQTTLELAACVERAVGRQGRTHPATKTFQAIRMAVNEELESLASVLTALPMILKPGGRLLIITFHSLEDRLVKRFLKHRSTAYLDDPSWPEPRPNPEYQFRLLAKKAIIPSAEEISLNPRARSAKLRVAELLESTL